MARDLEHLKHWAFPMPKILINDIAASNISTSCLSVCGDLSTYALSFLVYGHGRGCRNDRSPRLRLSFTLSILLSCHCLSAGSCTVKPC